MENCINVKTTYQKATVNFHAKTIQDYFLFHARKMIFDKYKVSQTTCPGFFSDVMIQCRNFVSTGTPLFQPPRIEKMFLTLKIAS